MTNKLEIKPERLAFTKSQVKFGALIDPKAATELIDEIERLRALLAAKPVPPIIQTLHANGDRIAMEATIAQQAQRIADLEADQVVERQPVAWVDPHSLAQFSSNERMWVRIAASLAENRTNGYTQPLYAEQPAPVAVAPSLWEIRVRDEPDNPESPCEYVYASSIAERDSILRRGGASVFAEYACLDKVKELNQ